MVMALRRVPALLLIVLVVASSCTLLGGSEEEASPRPGAGGTATIAISKPNSIDPSRGSNEAATFVLRQICLPLVEADPRTGELHPGAAESWEISNQGRRITFHLRPGVKFHDGTEVIAADYVQSLSRFVNPKTGSRFRFWLDRIGGYTAVDAGRSLRLSGVRAVDEATLQINLGSPFSELPAVLSHPSAGSAVPRDASKREGFSKRPVCTGPYMLEEPQEADGSMTLVPSEHYSEISEVYSRGGRGYLAEITLRVAGAEDGFALFKDGKVDLAEVPVTQSYVEAQQLPGGIHSGPNGLISYIGFPVRKKPFDNRLFRRALALSIDKSAIVEGVLAGSRLRPDGFLPPTAGPVSGVAGCEDQAASDPETARRALDESKVPQSALEFDIHFNQGEGHEDWLDEVREMWRAELDASTKLNGREYRSYLDFLVKNSQAGPFRLAWRVDYPSPEAIYEPLFQRGSTDNYIRYSSEDFQELLGQARRAVDDEERMQLYVEATEVLCRDNPMIVMWFGERHFVISEKLVAATQESIGIFGEPLLRELGIRS